MVNHTNKVLRNIYKYKNMKEDYHGETDVLLRIFEPCGYGPCEARAGA